MIKVEEIAAACSALDVPLSTLGVMIVDHGSRRPASNDALLDVVAEFCGATPYALVEPAHMELAEPSIETAYDRLVERGATFVVVHPYFLLPGRHWFEDVPRLAQAAAARHAVPHLVTAPLGIHRLMAEIINDRLVHCMQHVAGVRESCSLCDDAGRCQQMPEEA